ncbi:MAG: YgfZ/GcvT domain-containing protein [Gemmatimonadales bacterium]
MHPGSAARFTSVVDEYAALREGAGLVDRSARLRIVFGGAQAAETLTGLLTNDVSALQPGAGQYAAALTPKGKVIADVRVFARTHDLLLDTSENAGPGFTAMLRKYVNPRFAQFADVSATLRTLGLYGPRAHAVLASVLRAGGVATAAVETLRGLSPYHHVTFEVSGEDVMVARVPDLGVEGFDCFVADGLAESFSLQLVTAHAIPVGRDAADIARVEAGRPLWGMDMDANTLAQEANLDTLDGISYTKGCYTGQETVARVHFRGHVNRRLRGLHSAVAIPSGSELMDGDKSVGEVRSSVVSPRLGPIALALLRREVEPGVELSARWEGGEAPARVREIPFE